MNGLTAHSSEGDTLMGDTEKYEQSGVPGNSAESQRPGPMEAEEESITCSAPSKLDR